MKEVGESLLASGEAKEEGEIDTVRMQMEIQREPRGT